MPTLPICHVRVCIVTLTYWRQYALFFIFKQLYKNILWCFLCNLLLTKCLFYLLTSFIGTINENLSEVNITSYILFYEPIDLCFLLYELCSKNPPQAHLNNGALPASCNPGLLQFRSSHAVTITNWFKHQSQQSLKLLEVPAKLMNCSWMWNETLSPFPTI